LIFDGSPEHLQDLLARVSAASMRARTGALAYALGTVAEAPRALALAEDGKTTVLRIVLAGMPVPSDDTPWEQVFEFRADPMNRHSFLALRNWIAETARADLTPGEIAEKLEYLMSQYRRQMRLHELK